MRIVQLKLISNGQHIGASPIREQAMAAAKAHASKDGIEVSVIATMDSGNTREAVVKPDGSVDKVWQRRQGMAAERRLDRLAEDLCLCRAALSGTQDA